jgi:hypothetical protein
VVSSKERLSKGDFEGNGRCLVPMLPAVKNADQIRAIENSHDWIVDKIEPYGTQDVLARQHCSRCGLGRVSIFYDIDASANKRISLVTGFEAGVKK